LQFKGHRQGDRKCTREGREREGERRKKERGGGGRGRKRR